MAAELTLRVITPERIVIDTTAKSVRLPALDGSMGVFPRHAAMVAALEAGLLHYKQNGLEVTMFVNGGFAEVRGDTVRVLTGAGERPEEIDLERAKEAERRARERLAVDLEAARRDRVDFLRAEAALRRALLRQRLAGYRG